MGLEGIIGLVKCGRRISTLFVGYWPYKCLRNFNSTEKINVWASVLYLLGN